MKHIKSWGGALVAAAGVAACGGDLIAVLGALGAAGGVYTFDANPATAALETRRSQIADQDLFISIQVDGDNNGLGQNYFDETFPVTVTGGSLGGADCTGTKGRVNGDRLELGNCFQGRFESVNRVVSDNGSVVLRFDDFNPNLAIGIWVDIEDKSRRIKFISNTTGCELKGSTPTGKEVTLVQIFSDSTTGVLDSVQNFAIGNRVWTSGEYVGASGLRLTGGQDKLELQRQRDDPETVCP